MAPPETLIVIILRLTKPFVEFLSSNGGGIYDEP